MVVRNIIMYIYVVVYTFYVDLNISANCEIELFHHLILYYVWNPRHGGMEDATYPHRLNSKKKRKKLSEADTA